MTNLVEYYDKRVASVLRLSLEEYNHIMNDLISESEMESILLLDDKISFHNARIILNIFNKYRKNARIDSGRSKNS